MRKYILWTLAALVIAVMGTYVLTQVDLSILQQLSLLSVISLSFLTLLSGLINAIGGRLILKGLGYKPSLKDIYLVIHASGTASLVGNLKLGIPIRVLLYRTVLGIPLSIGTISIVLETALWLLIMAIIVAFGLPSILGIRSWVSSLLGFTLAITVTTIILSLPKIDPLIPDRLLNIPTSKVRHFIASFHQGISVINKTDLIKATCILAPNYLIEAMALYLILKEFGWNLNIFDLLSVIVFAYLVGLLSLMPMGIGTQDVSLVFLLIQLGVSQDGATAAVLVFRAVRLVIPVIVGLISIYILGINRFKHIQDSKEEVSEKQNFLPPPEAGEPAVLGEQ